MADIFEEVEEEVRKDKLAEWWSKFGFLVWIAAGLLIGGVALKEFMDSQAQAAGQERIEAFEVAQTELDAGKYAEAETSFSVIANEGVGLSPLAAQYLAKTRLVGNGDVPGALAALSAVADAEGDPFEKLSVLKIGYLKADESSLVELQNILGPMLTEESAFGALARELVAAKVYAAGDIAAARTAFNRLSFEANAPQSVKDRAKLALAAMPVVDTQPEISPETPAPAPVPAPEETPDGASPENEETGE